MSNIKHLCLLALALAGCGVKINGKSYGPGGGGNTSTGGTSGGMSEASAGENGNATDDNASGGDSGGAVATVEYAAPPRQCYDGRDEAPFAASPVDPWIGVENDGPVALAVRDKAWRAGPDCSALHDHCLRDCAWFVPRASGAFEEPDHISPVLYHGEDRWSGSDRSPGERPIYRTVPGTKRMLTPGALVLGLGDLLATPPSQAGKKSEWMIGRLERVDWKAGTFYLVGSGNPYRLSSARVAVLSWRKGGKVEILDKRSREQLGVRPDELFLPVAIGSVSDPWSQVGRDGQPLVVEDHEPFATIEHVCTPANDHCLRPWAWLVATSSGNAIPAKYDGKTFRAPEAIDELEPIENILVAYRTSPATRENLKVGMIAFVGGGTNEHAAHAHKWSIVKVEKISGDKFDASGTSRSGTWSLAEARIAVVAWYPGEKAEKVE